MALIAVELTEAVARDNPLADVLETMAERGTSVELGWGEDTGVGMWECSWITNGKRHTGFGTTPGLAILGCIRTYERFRKSGT